MPNLILALSLAAIAAAERMPAWRFEPARPWRRGAGTDLLYLATGAVGLSLWVRDLGVGAVQVLGPLSPGLAALHPLPGLLVATLLYDLLAYATHLLLHRVEWLWRFHKVHHSSPLLDWLATFRAHAIEHGLRHGASTGLLLLAGFPVGAVGGAAAIHGIWAALGHSNLRLDLRWLEPLFITPRLHRLHHEPATSERNLGMVFSLWDRLRGNLVTPTDASPTRTGVPGELDTYPQTWPAQLVEPFRRPREAD